MPVFTLSELATVAGKSPDTMRDWFDRGFFGEAGRRTPGGQRRVRAKSAEAAVAAARLHTKGYERHRLSAEQAGLRCLAQRIDRQMKKICDALPSFEFGRTHRHRLLDKRVTLVADTLFRASKDVLEVLGFGGGTNTDKALWEIPIAGPGGGSVITTALCILIAESGDWTKESTAKRAGLSTHEFDIFFGRYWQSARGFVEERLADRPEMIMSWGSETLDKNTGESVRQKEPTALPPRWMQTDDERRTMARTLDTAQHSSPLSNPFGYSEE